MIMKAVRSIGRDLRDAQAMGLGYLRHRLGPRHGTAVVPIRGHGSIAVRRNSSDPDVIRDVYRNRVYDLRGYPQWQRIAARRDEIIAAGRRPLVIDAGANNGASARWFAHLFPDAKVVAIEPEPENAELCRRNTADCDVEVLEQALGSEVGAVALDTDGREPWAVRTERSADGDVPMCTIGQIVEDHRPSCELLLVKIDIEGFESDVFAANTEWIDLAQVVIVEPHDWMLPGKGTSSGFQVEMARRNFELLVIGENVAYVRPDGAPAGAMAIAS